MISEVVHVTPTVTLKSYLTFIKIYQNGSNLVMVLVSIAFYKTKQSGVSSEIRMKGTVIVSTLQAVSISYTFLFSFIKMFLLPNNGSHKNNLKHPISVNR